MIIKHTIAARVLICALVLQGAGSAVAAEESPVEGHYDLWFSAASWPAMQALSPAAGGSFDDASFGIGMSFHWPLARFGNSDLLLGPDGFVQGNDSSVPPSTAT